MKKNNIEKLPSGDNYIKYDDIYDPLTYAELIDVNINNIEYLYAIFEGLTPPDTSGFYTKNEVDNLFLDYYTKEVIDDTFSKYYTITDIDNLLDDYVYVTDLDNYYTKEQTEALINNELIEYVPLDTYEVDYDKFTANIEKNTEDINTNTMSINNLEAVVSAQFETFGRYSIVGTEISDTDNVVRVNLTELIPLDPSLVTVSLSPNNFLNLNAGDVTFNIAADGLINNTENNLTLTLHIFLNGDEVLVEDKIIEAGKTVTVNYANVISVNQNDNVYLSLEISDGVGTLTTVNPVRINVSFASSGSVSAVKTSELIVDYNALPLLGINPWKTQIDDNTSQITLNRNDISDNIGEISYIKEESYIFINNGSNLQKNGTLITLTESIRNFYQLHMRLGLGNYRLAPVYNTRFMNVGDKIIIYKDTTGTLYLTINSFTEILITSDVDNWGLYQIMGYGRK